MAEIQKIAFKGGDTAPIISFDEVPFFGTLHGIGRLTLVAQVMTANEADGSMTIDHHVTVHLRGGLKAMALLRDTIDKMLLAAMPVAGPEN